MPCSKIAKKNNPKLWESIKNSIKSGSKGGPANKWSGRKSGLLVKEYKSRGGTFSGSKCKKNSYSKWIKADYQYAGKKGASRYLPKKAIKEMSPAVRYATNAQKRKGTKKGKQYVKQSKTASKITSKYYKP